MSAKHSAPDHHVLNKRQQWSPGDCVSGDIFFWETRTELLAATHQSVGRSQGSLRHLQAAVPKNCFSLACTGHVFLILKPHTWGEDPEWKMRCGESDAGAPLGRWLRGVVWCGCTSLWKTQALGLSGGPESTQLRRFVVSALQFSWSFQARPLDCRWGLLTHFRQIKYK